MRSDGVLGVVEQQLRGGVEDGKRFWCHGIWTSVVWSFGSPSPVVSIPWIPWPSTVITFPYLAIAFFLPSSFLLRAAILRIRLPRVSSATLFQSPAPSLPRSKLGWKCSREIVAPNRSL